MEEEHLARKTAKKKLNLRRTMARFGRNSCDKWTRHARMYKQARLTPQLLNEPVLPQIRVRREEPCLSLPRTNSASDDEEPPLLAD